MKFKEFAKWCNDRACDGFWGMGDAIFCADIVKQVNDCRFWVKERKWQKLNSCYSIEESIVIPINNKIKEYLKE